MKALLPVPRLLTLDSTGTLMRVKGPVGELYRDIMLAAVPSLQVALPSADALSKSFLEAHRLQSAELPCFAAGREGGCRGWWRRLVHDTLTGAGVEASALQGPVFDVAFSALYDDAFSGCDGWELLPETPRALAELRQWCDQSGCSLGVLSNMDERLPKVLDSLGLLRSFDFVLTSYDCGSEKPSPEIFAEARRRAGVDSDAPALHCGDSMKRDLLGAQSAGWHGILLDRSSECLQPLSLPDDGAPGHAGGPALQFFRAPHIGHLMHLLAGGSGL